MTSTFAATALIFSLLSILFCLWAAARLAMHTRRYRFEESYSRHILGFLSLRAVVWTYGIVIVLMSLLLNFTFLPLMFGP